MRIEGTTGAAGRAMACACAAFVIFASAGDAQAWLSNRVYARAGFETESSTSLDDTAVDALAQIGVPGVDDYSYFAHAASDSDAGLLLAESAIDYGEGATQTSSQSFASIEQWLVVDGNGPVTVQFLLMLDLAAQRVGTTSARAAGRLDIGTLCGLYVQLYAEEDPDLTDNCSEDYPYVTYETSLGAGALQVSVTYAAGHVPSTIDFLAQVENEITLYSADALGQVTAGASLSIEVAGATSYAFTSPTFLTVPEPGAALGFAALGALAVCRRRGATPRA